MEGHRAYDTYAPLPLSQGPYAEASDLVLCKITN